MAEKEAPGKVVTVCSEESKDEDGNRVTCGGTLEAMSLERFLQDGYKKFGNYKVRAFIIKINRKEEKTTATVTDQE